MVKCKQTVIKCQKNSLHDFSLSRNRIINDTDIKINGQMVTRVACTKFLGVLIDEKLPWANHIESIKMKISKGTGILNKARTYINLSTLVALYHSFIYPYLTYCLEVWRGAGDVYLLLLLNCKNDNEILTP